MDCKWLKLVHTNLEKHCQILKVEQILRKSQGELLNNNIPTCIILTTFALENYFWSWKKCDISNAYETQ